jgi:hypothetical protein
MVPVARSSSPAPSLLSVLLLCAVGCGDAPPSGPEIHFDACQDLVLVPDAEVTDAQLAGIRAGTALWNDRAGTRLSMTGAEAAQRLPIKFQRAAAPFHGFYDAPSATVFINQDLRDAQQAVVIAHEIGHAFSLSHVGGRSVMAAGNLDVEPTVEDVQALATVWGACAAPAFTSE